MIIIEGKKIINKEMLWEEVCKKIQVPDYFGKNLDAFADILSERKEKYQVKIEDREWIEKKLGNYGRSFLNILERNCNIIN